MAAREVCGVVFLYLAADEGVGDSGTDQQDQAKGNNGFQHGIGSLKIQ
ncbi:MAG: hypothetical protein AAFP69_05425 [Planctomycetota bacterium]